MAEEEEAPTPRRRSRSTSGGQRGVSGARRRRLDGAELVGTLNDMVSQLIKENRRLKRQLARLVGRAPEAANGAAERTLRSLHRKVQRAVAAVGSAPRRRRGTGTSAPARRRTARRSTTTSE